MEIRINELRITDPFLFLLCHRREDFDTWLISRIKYCLKSVPDSLNKKSSGVYQVWFARFLKSPLEGSAVRQLADGEGCLAWDKILFYNRSRAINLRNEILFL